MFVSSKMSFSLIKLTVLILVINFVYGNIDDDEITQDYGNNILEKDQCKVEMVPMLMHRYNFKFFLDLYGKRNNLNMFKSELF